MASLVRYLSSDEDSRRWSKFRFRDGDIVISTRSKSGTTWVQMICAMLVRQSPELEASLAEVSPWLDWLGEPIDDLVDRLDAQRHRRVVKTHTPLDGIPLDPRATYVVVGRHPLDIAVSLYHQGGNIDRSRVAELTGEPKVERTRPSLHDWLVAWIAHEADPRRELDSLDGIAWHVNDAWKRRDDPNVVLMHYSDLSRDLDVQMRALAARLGIAVAEGRWPDLVEAAAFSRMRDRAAALAPNAGGILLDHTRFFREGRVGAGAAVLDRHELAAYHTRMNTLTEPDVLAWLHHEGGSETTQFTPQLPYWSASAESRGP